MSERKEINLIRPVVGRAAKSYHGNAISSDSMPMMFIGGGNSLSEARIKQLRKSVEEAPKRAVRINRKPTHEIESTVELSKKDKKIIWYSKKELGEMLSANKELLHASRKNPNAGLCVRGLEDMMSIRASLNKKERRNAVLNAVLEEQKRQQAEKTPNPEKLRKRSKNASKESVKRALQFAHMDARAVNSDDSFSSDTCDFDDSYSFPEVKKNFSSDETVTTVTTMTTMSTISTFESNFRRRGGVDSVVQQPNTPRQSSGTMKPPVNFIIDTSGIVVDRKAKKLVLCPKGSGSLSNGSGHLARRTRTVSN